MGKELYVHASNERHLRWKRDHNGTTIKFDYFKYFQIEIVNDSNWVISKHDLELETMPTGIFKMSGNKF